MRGPEKRLIDRASSAAAQCFPHCRHAFSRSRRVVQPSTRTVVWVPLLRRVAPSGYLFVRVSDLVAASKERQEVDEKVDQVEVELKRSPDGCARVAILEAYLVDDLVGIVDDVP